AQRACDHRFNMGSTCSRVSFDCGQILTRVKRNPILPKNEPTSKYTNDKDLTIDFSRDNYYRRSAGPDQTCIEIYVWHGFVKKMDRPIVDIINRFISNRFSPTVLN